MGWLKDVTLGGFGKIPGVDMWDPLGGNNQRGNNAEYNEQSLEADQERLAGFMRSDFDDFKATGMPLIQDRLDSLNSNEITKRSNDAIAGRHKLSAGINKRNTGRYGIGMSKAQRNSLSKQRLRTNAATDAGTLNNARAADINRNNQQALELSNIGNNLRKTGTNNMRNAVGLGNEANMADASARASSQAQGMQTAGTLGAIAAMIW